MSDEFSVAGNREAKRENSVDSPKRDADDLRGTEWDIREANLLPDYLKAAPEPEEEKAADDAMPFAFPGMGDEEEPQSKGAGIDLARLIKGVWARRLMVSIIATVITAMFLAIAIFLVEKKWTADATLINRTSQDEFQVGKFGKPFKPQSYSLKTMLDTLLLPSVLQETIRRSQVEIIPRKLVKLIDVNVGKESRIFQVKVTWKDPNTAAKVANNLVDVFMERNREIRRSDAEQTLLYYSNQLQNTQQQARQVAAELQSFIEDYEISDLETEMTVLVTEITNRETELKALRAEVKALQEDVLRLDKSIEGEPEMIVQSSYYVNPLAKNLADLEWEYEQARGRYTDENPKVKDLKTRINKIRSMIGKGKDADTPSNTYASNPVRQDLTIRRYALLSDLKLRKGRLGALEKLVPTLQNKLATLTAKKQEYSQLTAKVANNEQLTSNLRNRVEESRIIMLRNESNFDLIERARPPDESEPSPKKLIAIAGVVLGSGAGVFLALILEFLDKRIRTRREAIDMGEAKLTFEFQEVPSTQQIVVDAKYPSEPVAGLFRRMANDMDGTLEPEDWQSLAVVSLEPRTGRTIVATNLAQTIAMKEGHVILVDADLRPDAGERAETLYEMNEQGPGLADYLDGDVGEIREVVQGTETPHAHLVRPGKLSPEDTQGTHRLGSRRMAGFIQALKKANSHVIYDLPPIQSGETVVEVVREIGNVLLVVRSGQSVKPEIRTMVERLTELGASMQVTVITEVAYGLTQEKPIFEPDAGKPVKKKKEKKAGKKSKVKEAKETP